MLRTAPKLRFAALFAASLCFTCSQENDVGNGQLPSECFIDTGAQSVAQGTFQPCAPEASCVPAEVIAIFDPALVNRVAPCTQDPTARCVPDVIIQGGMRYVPQMCTAFGNKEGRCLNRVIPEVARLGAILSRENCAANELCTPCAHPLTDEESGACTITPCDPGPESPETGFERCAGDTARCIPGEIIPEAYKTFLQPDTCSRPGGQCVSDAILACGPFQGCNSAYRTGIGDFTLSLGAGTCLDGSILNLNFGGRNYNDSIVADVCQGSELCVPCSFGGSPTNAPGCPGVTPPWCEGKPIVTVPRAPTN